MARRPLHYPGASGEGELRLQTSEKETSDMAPDMADDIRVGQIIQGYSLSEALGLGVYGGFAYRTVMGLVSSETAFIGSAAALSRLHRLAMRPDGEVALVRPAREDATREGIGRMLLRATYTAAYGQFGWGKAEAVPKRSAAQMRSCPDAGRLMRLDGVSATLAECVCLAEAVIGLKRREGLVKAYGEDTVRKAVGSPADPVTTAAIEALEREAMAVREEAGRRIHESAEAADRDIHGIVSSFLPAEGGEPPAQGERGSRPDPEMIEALEARARRGRAEREGIAEGRDARIRGIVRKIGELRAAAGEA